MDTRAIKLTTCGLFLAFTSWGALKQDKILVTTNAAASIGSVTGGVVQADSFKANDSANAAKFPRGDGTWQTVAGATTNTFSATGLVTLSLAGADVSYGVSTAAVQGIVTAYGYTTLGTVSNNFWTIGNQTTFSNWTLAAFAPITVTNVDLSPFYLTASATTLSNFWSGQLAGKAATNAALTSFSGNLGLSQLPTAGITGASNGVQVANGIVTNWTTLATGGGSSVNFSNTTTVGQLLVSNTTGWVAANSGDFRSILPTNDTTEITTYFQNDLATTNFIPINVGSWTFTNYLGRAYLRSPGEAVNQARIWAKLIPAQQQTNNWRATLIMGPVQTARKTTATSQSAFGLGCASATNSLWLYYGVYGANNVSSAQLAMFSHATPTSALAYWGPSNQGPMGIPAWSTPLVLRLTYTAASSNLAWSFATVWVGNDIRFVNVGSSNGIPPQTAVSIIANDQVTESPDLPLRAFLFEH